MLHLNDKNILKNNMEVSKNTIFFLGTGTSQGVPMLLSDEPVNHSTDVKDTRLRSSVFIKTPDVGILIDCGPDFRQQMLRAQVKEIDAILISHEHSDHIGGLDDIRPYCYRQGAIPILGLKRVLKSLEKRYDYIFATKNRYPGAAQVLPQTILSKPFLIKNTLIEPIIVQHGSLPILGYKIGSIAYLTDVKTIAEAELEKLQDLKILIISALRIEPHPTHLNLDEALALIAKINPQTAYLTHISHRLGFHKEISAQLPENVFLSYDGLEVGF